MEVIRAKKGLIFSLDAAVAVTVVIIMLINSSYYFSTSNRESVSQLQLIKIGNDIMRIRHLDNTLENLVLADITTPPSEQSVITKDQFNVSAYLPINYEMKFVLTDMKESIVNSTTNTGVGATCDASSCWGTPIVVNTLPVEKGDFIVRFAYTSVDPDGVITATLNGVTVEFTHNSSAAKSGLTLFGEFYPFAEGVNAMTFSTWGPQGIATYPRLQWFRVVGSFGYAAENKTEAIPTDRFIGSGQRVFSVDQNGVFKDLHLARFYIWLK